MNNISTYLHAFVYVELNLFCGNFLDLEKDSNEKLPVTLAAKMFGLTGHFTK